MASSISSKPNLVLTHPFSDRTRISNHPLIHPTHFTSFSHHKPFLRGSLAVARFGFKPGLFPDRDSTEALIKELFGRAESIVYTIADAAVSNSETISSTKQNTDWLSGITNSMESVLKVLKDGMSAVHVPYAYGFAIILLTVLVKAATFPLTKKQVESAMAMRSLQPQVKAIQQRYAGDQERIQLETARLYKLAGINPLAGCLPTLATIPVWIGLYRALSNVADEGLLTEGFFWIPSLAGPTTVAARQSGSGISWLFPFVDGHPPLGWSDTLAYLVLPLLLVVTQYISVQIMQSSQNNDPNMKSSQALTKVLPLMIGYFALSVPSGLSLYWFTNNILSTAQQVWLQKLGGAKNLAKQFSDDMIKEDQLRIQKSASELNSSRKESVQEEKLTSEGLLPGERFKQIKEQEEEVAVTGQEELTSEGLRPGERFKQIKEQEARRRQQREEEKRKSEEEAAAAAAAAEGILATNEAHVREANLLDRENGAGANLVDEKNEKLMSVTTIRDSSNGGVVVNGDLSSQESKENSEVSTNFGVDRRDEYQSNKNIEKEAVRVYTSTTTTDNKLSEEDTHQTGRE